MSFFQPQNPGIGGLEELTSSEEIFLHAFTALSYSDGDIIYYNNGQLRNLPIGTSGQVLKVTAGLPAWGAGGSGSSPLTTKGDVYTFSTADDRLPVGTNGQVLSADSTAATGLKWINASGTGDALVANPLSQFAATTSLQLKGVISDETGSGALVFATSPTLVTPVLGAATGTSLQLSGLTASEILITDASKNIVSAAVATYPSLIELTYVKGVTSAIQTQLNTKQATITFGTGVLTALGVNIGSAGAPVLFNGAGGTPSSLTLTNATGLPISTGVSGLGTSIATALAVNAGSAGSVVINNTTENITGTKTMSNIVLPDQGQIKLTVPTTDLTATGFTTSDFNCGYTSSAIGDLVYLDSSATWQKADNTTSATTRKGMLAIVLEVKASGNAMKVALPGSFIYSTTGFPTWTIGLPIYMSTSGSMTQTEPTATDAGIRKVGYAVHADKMYFNPDNIYITHV